MKAKDIEQGTEYVECTQDPLSKSTWANKNRVRILEVPVVGWARRYSWGNTYPIKGKVDSDPDARKDHVLVQRIVRDRDKEQVERSEAQTALLLDTKHSGAMQNMDQDEKARYARKLFDTIQVPDYWKDGGTDRVRLRDIKMTWEAYTKERDHRAKVAAELKQNAEDFDQQLEELSDRLPEGLTIKRGYFNIGHGGNRSVVRPVVIQGYGNHKDLLHLLNKVLEETL